MRITEQTKHNSIQNNLSKNQEKVFELNNQISTGKKVNKLSDNPVLINSINRHNQTIKSNDAWLQNMSENMRWSNQYDDTLSTLTDLLSEVRVKAVQAANSYHSDDSLNAIASETESILKKIIDVGNSKIGKLYLFSGTKTFTEPLIKNNPITDSQSRYPRVKFESVNNFSKIELKREFTVVNVEEPLKIETRNLETNSTETVELVLPNKGSITSIIDSFNQQQALLYNNTTEKDTITGFKQDIYFGISDDGKFFIQPKQSNLLENVIIPEDLQKIIGSVIAIGSYEPLIEYNQTAQNIIQKEEEEQEEKAERDINNPEALKKQVKELNSIYDEPQGQENIHVIDYNTPYIIPNSLYGEQFRGFADKEFIVKVTKQGRLGAAEYAVSDDDGVSFSPAKTLSKKNVVSTQDEDDVKTNNLFLEFNPPTDEVEFILGTEFKFSKNPFIIYQGNQESRNITLQNNEVEKLNIDAQELFFSTDNNTVNIFDLLNNLVHNIKLGDAKSISNSIGGIDQAISQVLKQREENGILGKRIIEKENDLSMSTLNAKNELSTIEDVNVAEAVSQLKLAETQGQATRQSSAKLIQPSLVHFLN